MPRGFIGEAAALFLGRVSKAHTNAIDAGRQVPAHAPASPREGRLPFEPEEAFTGGRIATGRGDSSNIVVARSNYDAIQSTINKAEDRIGECLYYTAIEIEALCQTAFILPAAVPRCLNISETVKRSLGDMRATAEDATLLARNFAREMTEIG